MGQVIRAAHRFQKNIPAVDPAPPEDRPRPAPRDAYSPAAMAVMFMGVVGAGLYLGLQGVQSYIGHHAAEAAKNVYYAPPLPGPGLRHGN